MENRLEIKYRNQKQVFEILDSEIIADLNTSKHKLKYNIPLEEIKNTQFISKAKQDGFAILAYISFFLNFLLISTVLFDYKLFSQELSLVLFFTLTFGAVVFVKIYFEDYNEKHIDSSKLLYFIYTKKNAAEVDKFIELIYQKQISFFKKKYFKIDPILPYNIQYERYIWLYTNKYITENEYEVIKEDLDKYFNFNPSI